MRDFTLTSYRNLLLALQAANYKFFTFEEYCNQIAEDKFVILRHDVDLMAKRSLATARIEAELGLKATYYFRIVPQSNQPDSIRKIAALGHEIGYHYEDLSLFKGDVEKSIEHFKNQLAYFRQYYPVKTICMHGSPASKYDNRHLWKSIDYRSFGIVGEPYFDFLTPDNFQNGVLYFTDTARMWDGDKFNVRDKFISSDKRLVVSDKQLPGIHSTFDFINWLETENPTNSMMITTHPQRWTDNKLAWWKELILQRLKNEVKRGMINGKW